MIAAKSSPLVMVEMTDPQEIAKSKAQRDRFRKNSEWLQARVPQVYAQNRGKFICVAGQELFVADTAPEAVATARRAHPENDGFLLRYIPREKIERIYAHEWTLCDDGIVRPVVEGELLASDGSWLAIELLMDVGADRTAGWHALRYSEAVQPGYRRPKEKELYQHGALCTIARSSSLGGRAEAAATSPPCKLRQHVSIHFHRHWPYPSVPPRAAPIPTKRECNVQLRECAPSLPLRHALGSTSGGAAQSFPEWYSVLLARQSGPATLLPLP
jgi:hypothetical protein